MPGGYLHHDELPSRPASRDLQVVYPLVVDSALGSRGVYAVGRGKSGLAKSLALWMSAFGVRVYLPGPPKPARTLRLSLVQVLAPITGVVAVFAPSSTRPCLPPPQRSSAICSCPGRSPRCTCATTAEASSSTSHASARRARRRHRLITAVDERRQKPVSLARPLNHAVHCWVARRASRGVRHL